MKKIVILRKLTSHEYRQARGTTYPELADAGMAAELSYEVVYCKAMTDVALKRKCIFGSIIKSIILEAERLNTNIIYIDDFSRISEILTQEQKDELSYLDVRELDELYRIGSQTDENLIPYSYVN